ncbi:hypothetical protein C0J52_09457 [Blattella germanica]|nr:hypothetical protein C0J52_09457 [Blattella germanica]PSN54140.1 hypothetical protein C0J52_09457 [Blattella germanica]
MFGPKYENEEWKIRTNKELYDLYDEPQIITTINSIRLRWVEHVERSEEGSLLQRIWRGKLGGRKCVGRPRRKWMENVKENMRELGVREWRRTNNRNEWAKIVRQALGL